MSTSESHERAVPPAEAPVFYGKVTCGERTIFGRKVVVGVPHISRVVGFQSGQAQENPWESAKPTRIGSDCLIGDGTIIYEDTIIGDKVIVIGNCIIGSETEWREAQQTRIGDNCRIENSAVINEGSRLGNSVSMDNCKVGFDCRVGDGTRLLPGVVVADHVRIGRRCTIGGVPRMLIGDRSVIGGDCQIFGSLVHELSQPHKEFGNIVEPAPRIGKKVIIEAGATIVGGITIGDGSLVKASAVVTKDVPLNSVVVGRNQITTRLS
jgi:acetyltransferase-like isoleucine patch superfamily enzyme